MGQLVSRPYQAADGLEYVSYLQHLLVESEGLRRIGRLPDTDAVVSFFDYVQTIVDQLRRDLSGAATGGPPIVSRFVMTASAYRGLMSMNESLSTLLEILEIRQVIDLQRTPGSARVAEAIREGHYEES